jgi:type IV pilus assembly protein PilY1
MKSKKRFFAIFIILSMLSAWSVCYGLDTELYVLSGSEVPPNVLIILDNSASMSEVVQDLGDYNPNTNYTQDPYNSSVYSTYAVYVKSGSNWVQWAPDYRTIACTGLKDYLTQFGMANNYSGCDPPIRNKDFRTGNYLNYLNVAEGQGANRPRFGLANGIIKSYTNTTGGVRFALMVFNNDATFKTVKYDATNKVEYVDAPSGFEDANGGRVLGFIDELGNGKTALFNTLAGLKNETWSPLAETLAMTETYFRTGLNGFSSPIQYPCQKNYVLIISDGNPTKDTGNLVDVASTLFNLDLSNGESLNPQNIRTYTIRFTAVNQLMMDTARAGGGKDWYVASSQSFSVAFQNFIADVLKESTSYVAPVVPISQMERTSAGNRMYLAMFKPTEKSFWKGNIKKYGIATENIDPDKDNVPTGNFPDTEDIDYNGNKICDYRINFGDILDATGAPTIDSNNKIKDGAKSYWSSVADGGEVESGGVGGKLLEKIGADGTSTRNIYTYLGNTNLNDPSNAFTVGNTQYLTSAELDVGSDTERQRVIDFVHGLDAYDWEGPAGVPDGIRNVKRSWILGAFIHSRPMVVHYDQDHSVIFAGANDGMLHAFDDESGEELWAFIPRSLLGSLKNFNLTDNIQFFVDGAPRAYIERDSTGTLTKGILIFGLRRGGNRYIALDISTRLAPKLLWEIGPERTGYGELGQTWSIPLIGKIKSETGDPANPISLRSVAFVGGGYDVQEDILPPGTDGSGRAVYVIDIFTGDCIWSYSNADNASMKYSIPSDVARVDTNGDGAIDRLYVGDTGGQMWRFDISDPNPSGWKNPGKVKVVFDSNQGATNKRKIFYPPEVTLEKGDYEWLFFGTGDREHPKWRNEAQGIVDRLYGIKDKNPSAPLAESDLVDVTVNLLPVGTAIQEQGWYIKLEENSEEKCLANAVIFYGVVYYTTFVPSIPDPTDPDSVCFLSAGRGRLYALQYSTGNAVFDFDNSLGTELTRRDRWMDIGVSIPSGVVITFIQGKTLAYGGEGGGIYRARTPSSKTLFPLSWRIAF